MEHWRSDAKSGSRGPTRSSHGLAWDWTRVSAVRRRSLSSWDVAPLRVFGGKFAVRILWTWAEVITDICLILRQGRSEPVKHNGRPFAIISRTFGQKESWDSEPMSGPVRVTWQFLRICHFTIDREKLKGDVIYLNWSSVKILRLLILHRISRYVWRHLVPYTSGLTTGLYEDQKNNWIKGRPNIVLSCKHFIYFLKIKNLSFAVQ
jgi:hypothetical protein